MNPTHPVQMAGMAQKMAKFLFLDCPPNYQCGGPAYAALVSMDAILGMMGIGIAMIQRKTGESSDDYQQYVRESAVSGNHIFSTFVRHKSQILASALYAILCDVRTQKLRESPEVAENALLSAVQLFLKKTGTDRAAFIKKIEAGEHDELEQLEVNLRAPSEKESPKEAQEGGPEIGEESDGAENEEVP